VGELNIGEKSDQATPQAEEALADAEKIILHLLFESTKDGGRL
jgi:hypothetical protein